ncbi:MAG: PD-(D/E)XK nuclease family transposase [Spirochaetales bacterium]
MPYSPLTHDSVFLHVFGEPEGLPLLESLVNAHFEAVGPPLVHKLQLQPRDLPPEHGEKLALVDILAEDETGRIVNVEVQTTRKPAYFERALFYWARLFARQLPAGDDYDKLQPVISLNFLEYEISKRGPWLHHCHLPHTAHLGFLFVELPKLLKSPDPATQLKRAMIGAAYQRMEAYMSIAPEVYNEIRRSMALHDIASYKGEGFREGEARGFTKGKLEGKVEVAKVLLAEGMNTAKVAELTGLPLATVDTLASSRQD